MKQDLFWFAAPWARFAGRSGRRFGFLSQRSSLIVRDEACQFRNKQSRTAVKLATMVLLGTRGPWLFQVVREGLGCVGRLQDRGALCLANRLQGQILRPHFTNTSGPLRKPRVSVVYRVAFLIRSLDLDRRVLLLPFYSHSFVAMCALT